jgi:two-component system cell cycle sensor histidine kinase/response regulator CckA
VPLPARLGERVFISALSMDDLPAPPQHSHELETERRGPSIQLRLLALVMAAALPALVFSIVQSRTANRVERADAEQRALQLARRIATRVDDHVNTVDALLVALSRTVRIDQRSVAHNDSLLGSVRHDLGVRFLNLSVSDARGRIVGLSSAATGRDSLDVSDRKYFREAIRTRGLGIGEPMIGRVSNQYSLALGRAILDSRGVPVGVVAASTQLDQLRALLIPADLPAETVVTLLDARGVVLARSKDAEQWVGRDVSGYPAMQGSSPEPEGVVEVTGLDGVHRLSGFATAARVPWSVYVGIASEVALARVHEQERQTAWLFGGSLTVSLMLAWLLARGIAAPVRALTDDAAAFASGDLAHRTTVRADGEVGTLALTFNRMADALQRHGDQLSESEMRYRHLFETLPLPMWVYDVDSLRFLAVNGAAIERYGYSRDEFLALRVTDIRPAADMPAFLDVVTTGRPSAIQAEAWRHRTRSGELLEVEISSSTLEYGEASARLVVVNDVTVRRRTELALLHSQEQLRQSQKMEAIGSLAGGVAHDFNNLLTAILGYCDLALEGLEPESTAAGDVAEIRRAAQRAAELTHQLLAFSRRQVLKTRVFSLAAAVEPSEKILRRLISENIALEMRADPDTPLVRADPTQLEQVILNLAVNARDAMPRGGMLRLATRAVTLDRPFTTAGTTLPPGRYAALEVMDTGTGIAPEIMGRVFEPFFTTKERGQGTGLGLATVYGIVEQSGGGIVIDSTVGAGTTFTLYFPVAAAPAETAEATPRPPSPSPRGEGTILLAEDDDAVRAIARETLERGGYHVLAAPDGHTALQLADGHQGPIDLLLTDVIMPGMNGRELAEALALRRPGVRVLFASGYTDNVLLDHGVLAVGLSLLDKPFTPATLAARVAAMMSAAAPAVEG